MSLNVSLFMKGKLPPIVAGNRNIIMVSQKIH